MKSRLLAAAAAAAAVATFGISGTATAGGDAKVRVTIQASGEVFGYVYSDKLKCKKERKVTLWLKEPGDDDKVVSDTTEKVGGDWQWSAGNPGVGGERVYASVRATNGCEADKSPTVTAEVR